MPGGSLLYQIDFDNSSFSPEEVFYVRYMADFVLLTRTRWQLRRGIARLVEFLDLCGFERYPDKTQKGRLCKGFDWLGIGFGAETPAIAPRAVNNHRERRAAL